MLFRKKQVYLSSTFLDLRAFRESVKRALEPAGVEVEHMERYAAFEERPLDKCLADVRCCDYYVLIVARRYGFVPPLPKGNVLSITQLEYEEAIRHKRPCFVFILADNAEWPAEFTDAGWPAESLPVRGFMAALAERHGTATFKNPEELCTRVLQAISAYNSAGQRKRRRSLAGAAASAVAALCIWLAWPEPDPVITAADWLRAVSRSQGRLIADISSAWKSRPRNDAEYLAKLLGDAGGWVRFSEAFAVATAVIDKALPSYGSRKLRRDLRQGNISSIVTALRSIKTNASGQAQLSYILGAFLEVEGHLGEAFESYDRATRAEPVNVTYATAALNLATNMGMTKAAIDLAQAQRRALSLEPTTPKDNLATVMGYEALAYWFEGDADKAGSLFEQALQLTDQPAVRARLLNDRVPLFNQRGDLQGAEKTLRDAALLYRCSLPVSRNGLVASLLNLTAALARQGRTAEAADSLSAAAQELDATGTEDVFPALRAQVSVAEGLLEDARSNAVRAQSAFATALRVFHELHMDDSFLASRARQYLGRVTISLDSRAAQQRLAEAVSQNLRIFGAEHSETVTSRVYLASAFVANQDLSSAAAELAVVESYLRPRKNASHRFFGQYLATKARTVIARGRSDSALAAQGLDQLIASCKQLNQSAQSATEALVCWQEAARLAGRLGRDAAQINHETERAKASLSRKAELPAGFVPWSNQSCPKS